MKDLRIVKLSLSLNLHKFLNSSGEVRVGALMWLSLSWDGRRAFQQTVASLHFPKLLGNISFYLEWGAFLFKVKKKKKAKSNTYSLLAPWGTICLCSCQMPDSVYQLVINCVWCCVQSVFKAFWQLHVGTQNDAIKAANKVKLQAGQLDNKSRILCRLTSTFTQSFVKLIHYSVAVFWFFLWLQLCLLLLISSNWHPWKNTWLSNHTWRWLSVFWWAHTLVFRLDTSISQQVTQCIQTGFSGLAHRLALSFIVFARWQHEFPQLGR